MRQLGLDFLTVMEATAPQMIELAASHGITWVNLLVPPFPPLPYYDLIGDTVTRRETARRCRDLGVQIDMIEPFSMHANVRPEDFRPALETGAYLQARWINVLSRDTDPSRIADNFGRMTELADEYGLRVFTEFHRRQYLKTLQQTVEFLTAHQLDAIGIEVDALHFFRMGGDVAQIRQNRDWIVRAQLCDGPADMPEADQNAEAREHRLPVGEGSFPLQDFVDALPQDIVLGIEAPHRTYGMKERLQRNIDGALRLNGIAPLVRR